MKIKVAFILTIISFSLASCLRKHELTDVFRNESGEDVIFMNRGFSSGANPPDKQLADGDEYVMRYFESRMMNDDYSNCPIDPISLESKAIQIGDSVFYLTDIPERLEWSRSEIDRHNMGNRQRIECTCVFK